MQEVVGVGENKPAFFLRFEAEAQVDISPLPNIPSFFN